MGPKRVMWVRRYQGQCRALRPLGHQGYRLRSHNKDQPLCSGYTLIVQVSTGIPYSHTSNLLCERQIRVLKENVRIWCKTERTRDWLRLLPIISLMVNSQESSATGYSPMSYF